MKKGSTSTFGPASYLLRLNSLHQRHYRYLSCPDYIPGPINSMADDCSRLWHLTDSQLLAHFNSKYPQNQPWKLVHLRPEMLSSVTSALQKQRQTPVLFLNDPKRKTIIGKCGKATALTSKWTHTYAKSRTSYLSSKYSPPDYEEETIAEATNLSDLNKWRTTYALSVRKSPAWGPVALIPGGTTRV